MRKVWILPLILVAFLVLGMGRRPRIEEIIRVVISNGSRSVLLSSKTPYTIYIGSGNPLKVDGRTKVEARMDKVFIAEKGISADLVRFVPSGSGLIELEGRRYRGIIEVSTNGNGGLLLANELEIEQYLYGVVGKELSSNWPKEALKAQAVASRTFALFRKLNSKGKNYLDAVMSQAYGGYDAESKEVREAVDETGGEVMVDNDGKLIPAFFHTSCGGMTESSEEVFGYKSPHLVPILCPYCSGYPGNIWFLSLTDKEIGDIISNAYGERWDPVELIPLERTLSGRIRNVKIRGGNGKEGIMKATDLRKLIGYNRLKSTYFDVVKIGNRFDFVGIGFGHGVGMCQWGARGMAEMGKDYREILGFYYPGARISIWTGGE